MYRRLTGLTIFVFGFLGMQAQLSVSLQEPPAGIVQKNQLWNMTLIYAGNSTVDVTIGLTLVNVSDNQPVLSAYSRSLTLTKGVKQLKAADILPVDYTYVSPAFSRLSDAFLPVGSYQACYTFYSGNRHAETILSEDCMNIDVQPLSPPELVMPADSSSVESSYPQFSWLPPAPLMLFNDLNYELILTEVRADQTPGAAIQENIPLFNGRRLTTPMNTYPSSSRSLDTGKVYAWRVIAKNGETFIAQSDVWTFRIAREKNEIPVPAGGVYMEVSNSNTYSNTGIIPDDVLGIKYYSYDKTHDAVIRFLNEKEQLVKEVNRSIVYGNNFMVFKLDHSFDKDTTYFIEITDLQGSRYKASFRISK